MEPTAWAVIPGSPVDLKIPVKTPLPIGTYTVQSTVTREDGTVLDSKTVNFKVAIPFTPPPTTTTVTLTPQAEGVLVSPDGRYSVTFPAGSVLSIVDVTLKPLQLSMAPMGTNTVKLGSSIFTVEGLAGLLAKPATVRVKYSEDDLRSANGDLSSLKLARFDAGENAWTVLPTTREGDTLVTQSDRMGTWAVISSPGGAGGSTGIDTNTLMILGGIIAVIVIAIAALLMRKKKNTS
jgi:LPXTG-motif cell wall-anchored protein